MAKFYGVIGYTATKETSPGVWTEDIVERNYSGDVIRDTKRWQEGQKNNDDLVPNHQISIISDSFALDNLYLMRYIKWMGASWKITNIEVQRPRLLLTIGGVYNGTA
jgi:hypothetical protein